MAWVVGIGIIIFLIIIIKPIRESQSNKANYPIKQLTEKQKEPPINYWVKEVRDVLEKNGASSVLLCSAQSTLPRIPKGDKCYLLTQEDRLKIKTVNEPIMTYGLDYEKIYLFKKIEIDTDLTSNQVIIQYVDDESSIKELTFEYETSGLINKFNRFALRENNIFEVVESRIPRRDNDVML